MLNETLVNRIYSSYGLINLLDIKWKYILSTISINHTLESLLLSFLSSARELRRDTKEPIN